MMSVTRRSHAGARHYTYPSDPPVQATQAPETAHILKSEKSLESIGLVPEDGYADRLETGSHDFQALAERSGKQRKTKGRRSARGRLRQRRPLRCRARDPDN